MKSLRRDFESFSKSIKQKLKDMEEKSRLYTDKSISKIKADLTSDLSVGGVKNVSAVYVRWGKKICPQNVELVYSGYAGGSYYTHTGAAVEPLCLPKDPQWGYYKDGFDGYKQFIYGAEFRTYDFRKSLSLHDVPCSVCRVYGKSAVYTVPARNTCHRGWTLEYSGYLMSGYHAAKAASKFTCVDKRSR
ncbi:short-chain collagen C4-like [Saccostrea cucullata]|uniref:short-chain collagen C4-like n=1 Tax=Saccostrea cuccullata TaxID=36930 RepID=UPI002ED59833